MNAMYVNSQSCKKHSTPLRLFVLGDQKLMSSFSTDIYPSLVNHDRMSDSKSCKAVTVQQVVKGSVPRFSSTRFKHYILPIYWELSEVGHHMYLYIPLNTTPCKKLMQISVHGCSCSDHCIENGQRWPSRRHGILFFQIVKGPGYNKDHVIH